MLACAGARRGAGAAATGLLDDALPRRLDVDDIANRHLLSLHVLIYVRVKLELFRSFRRLQRDDHGGHRFAVPVRALSDRNLETASRQLVILRHNRLAGRRGGNARAVVGSGGGARPRKSKGTPRPLPFLRS